MVDKQATKSSADRRKVSNLEHIAVLAFSAMNQFRKTEKLCDIRILAGTSEFLAHKVVLAAYSPYFEAMFSGQFEESQKPFVKITDIKADTLSIILDYLYTGKLELTENNIQAVLHASNFLQIVPLFESCCNFLLVNMNPGNCLGIYTLGKMLSCAKVKDKSKDYAMIHFSSVCQEIEFLELDAESLIDIIGSDSLIVQSEESVFHAVLQWLHLKEEERTSHFPDVLRHVRLALLTPEFLKNHVETEEAISKSPACMQQVKEAERLQPQRSEFQCPATRQRNASPVVEAILVFGEYLPGEFTRRENAWKLFTISINGLVLKELKQPRYFEYCCVSHCQTLLLAPHRDTIWRFDSSLNDWQPIAPLIKRRFSFGLCEVDGFWYAIGGFIPGSDYHTRIFNNVERYQPSSDVWVQVAPMPEGIMDPAVVALQGMLYVLGGENKNGSQVNLVQRYDPRTNTWSEMPPFRVLGGGLKACALYHRIYLFFNGERSPVQVYNAASNVWEECAQNKHRFASGPVIFDRNIYILSKRSNGDPVIERYSPTDGCWEDVAVFSNFRPQSIFRPLRVSLPRKVNLKEECIMNLLHAHE